MRALLLAMMVSVALSGCVTVPGPISGPGIQITYTRSGQHQHAHYWKGSAELKPDRLIEAMADDPEAQHEMKTARNLERGGWAAFILGNMAENAIFVSAAAGAYREPGSDGRYDITQTGKIVTSIGVLSFVTGLVTRVATVIDANDHYDKALYLYNQHARMRLGPESQQNSDGLPVKQLAPDREKPLLSLEDALDDSAPKTPPNLHFRLEPPVLLLNPPRKPPGNTPVP